MKKVELFYFRAFIIMTIFPGLVFLRSGFTKLITGTFPDVLGGILVKFAEKNPNPLYKSFLETTAIPNAATFGYLVQTGEVLTALAIVGSCLYILWKSKVNVLSKIALVAGLAGGLFLNINFLLGGGWTNTSKEGLNMLMIMMEVASLFFVLRFPANKKGA